MADDSRAPSHSVALEVSTPLDPSAQDFFQLLRRLECRYRDLPRLGEALRPAQEAVRLGQEASLAFEASTVRDIGPSSPDQPSRVQVSFFGLLGPNGPLPLHLTEYIRQRERHGHDPTFGRFIDLFHHRLLALFYRAWANARPTVSHDRPDQDRFARYVGAQLGIGTSGHVDPADHYLLHMAQHFACQTRHPEGLCKVLGDYFGVPAAIEEYIGEWLEVPDAYRWRLGNRARGHGPRLGMLGNSTRVGRRVWDRQQKFRVVLGPLRLAQYQRLLPGGADLPQLVSLVRQYVGHELRWDLRLILADADMRPTRLGKRGRLGRTAYLVRQASTADRPWQDVVFDPLSRTAAV